MSEERNVGRSIGAVVGGILVSVVLSLVTDYAMMKLGYLPEPGHPPGSGPLAAATIYRTIYGVIGSYVCARLAPRRPMFHSMVLGALGLVPSIGGVALSWNHTDVYGPRWYPLALAILALPTAWLGAKLYESRGLEAGQQRLKP
jgi:hypothetical protein